MKKILLFAGILFISAQCGPGTPEQQAQSMYEYEKRYDAEIQRLEGEETKEKIIEKETSTKKHTGVHFFILVISLLVGTSWIWYPPMKKYWDEIEVD